MNRLVDLCICATSRAREYISIPDMLGVSASEVKVDDCVVDFKDEDEDENFLSPSAQIIVTASWLTIKEGGLVIGALASRTKHTKLISNAWLKKLGEHLISVILEVKHAGAIDKTRIGLKMLCECLLDEKMGASLSSLPMQWLNGLLHKEILNKSKLSVKHRVRRSAGIPFAFLAILLAEKSLTNRKMFKLTIVELFKLLELEEEDDEIHSVQIHAFNVLRVVFKDRDLGVDASMFSAKGIKLCLYKMRSLHWEVCSRIFVVCLFVSFSFFLFSCDAGISLPRFCL